MPINPQSLMMLFNTLAPVAKNMLGGGSPASQLAMAQAQRPIGNEIPLASINPANPIANGLDLYRRAGEQAANSFGLGGPELDFLESNPLQNGDYIDLGGNYTEPQLNSAFSHAVFDGPNGMSYIAEDKFNNVGPLDHFRGSTTDTLYDYNHPIDTPKTVYGRPGHIPRKDLVTEHTYNTDKTGEIVPDSETYTVRPHKNTAMGRWYMNQIGRPIENDGYDYPEFLKTVRG